MGLTYQEKSIWGSLIIILVAFAYYFAGLFGGTAGTSAPVVDIPRLIAVVGIIIVVEVIYHIVIAVKSGGSPKDERDQLIDTKAYRNAYFFLSVGLFAAIASAVWIPDMTAHVLIVAMVIAECSHFVSQLYYYRSGI
jgi:hypothetical protein